jgi:hypothetical protein
MVGPPKADHPGIIEKLIWESLQTYLLQKSAKVVLIVQVCIQEILPPEK